MDESHHDVGHLHAGVVNVVLHFHVLAAEAQQAHKRVAQHRVAQVADVRSLVGIDAGVLHQNFTARAEGGRTGGIPYGKQPRGRARAIQMKVQIPGSGHRNAFHSVEGSDQRHKLFGDFARWPAHLLCQLKTACQGNIAHFEIRR